MMKLSTHSNVHFKYTTLPLVFSFLFVALWQYILVQIWTELKIFPTILPHKFTNLTKSTSSNSFCLIIKQDKNIHSNNKNQNLTSLEVMYLQHPSHFFLFIHSSILILQSVVQDLDDQNHGKMTYSQCSCSLKCQFPSCAQHSFS